MIHECNRVLESVWRAAADGRERQGELMIGALDFVFLARRFDEDHYVFTHVGAALSAVHGRRLGDQNLLGLWRRDDRSEVREALESSLQLRAPLLIRSRGRRMDGGSIDFEGTIWPLAGPQGAVDRLLGALAPCVGSCGDRPVIEHALDEIGLMPRGGGEAAPRSQALAKLLVAEAAR